MAAEQVIYKEIGGFDGAYRIGSDGSIWTRWSLGGRRRKLSQTWRLLKASSDKDGYLQVGLYLNGFQRVGKVHRLVLESFVGPCPNGYTTRHLNGNPSDNRLCNLEWNTPKVNVQDTKDHGRFFTPWKGEMNHKGKLTKEKVREIRRKLAAGRSQASLGREYDVHGTTIHGIAHNKYWAWLT